MSEQPNSNPQTQQTHSASGDNIGGNKIKSDSYWIEIGGDATGIIGDILGGNVYQNIVVTQKSKIEITQETFHDGSPYKGLEQFTGEDWDKFFGRKRCIEDLTKYLKTKSFLLLWGASGSGKSSLIQAGVIHNLKGTLANNLIDLTFVPDVNPFKKFSRSLDKHNFDLSKAEMAEIEAEDTLIRIVDELKEADKTWLIFIDQFEELFTRTPKQTREIFIKALNRLIERQDTTVKIILTMRADFLDKLNDYHTLGELRHNYSWRLKKIEESGVRLAIAEPAAINGVIFEKGLVEQIIGDFQFKDEDKTGALPLLQYTLDLLWQKSSLQEEKGEKNRTLTLQTYHDIGGVKGALKKQAQKIYEKFTADEQKIVEQILVELIDLTVLEKKEAVVSRRVKKETLDRDEKQAEVLEVLIRNRLLVSQGKPKEATVEVAHEELLRAWDVITNLIAEKRELINRRNLLTTDAEQYHKIKQQSPQRAKSELWRGTKLNRIIEFKDKGLLPNLDEVATDFIEASLIQEKQQATAGLRTAKTLATMMTTIAIESRTITIMAVVIAGVSFLGLLGTGWFALRERKQAEIANQKTEEAEFNLADSLARNTLSRLNNNEKDLDTLLMAIRAGKILQEQKKTNPLVDDALSKTLLQIWEINRIEEAHGESSPVRNIAFSPNGQFLASGEYIAFSPNGQFLASGGIDFPVKIWDVQTGKLKKYLNPEQNPSCDNYNCPTNTTIISFNSDGKFIASAGSVNDEIYIFNFETGEVKKSIQNPDGMLSSLSFHPDSKILSSTSYDSNIIRLWNIETEGEVVHSLVGHNQSVNRAIFSPDGKVLASISEDQTVKLWNAEKNYQEICTFPQEHKDGIYSIDLHENGTLAVSSRDTTISLGYWNQNDCKVSGTIEAENLWMYKIRFSPDGKMLASGNADGTITLWDVDTRKIIRTFKEHRIRVESLRFSPHGNILASGGITGTIKLWDVEKFKKDPPIFTINQHKRSVNTVQFHPTNQDILVSASNDKTIKLFNIKTGEVIKTVQEYNKYHRSINNAIFSPDGSVLVSIMETKDSSFVKLWRINKYKTKKIDVSEINMVSSHPYLNDKFFDSMMGVTNIAFSPNGSILASVHKDNNIKLWQVGKDEQQGFFVFNLLNEPITISSDVTIESIAFNHDSSILASGSWDGTIKLWNVNTGKEIRTLTGHNKSVNSLSFNHDSSILASGSWDGTINWDGTIKLWNVNTGKEIRTLTGHNKGVNSLSFNHDGSILASSSEDLKLWDVNTGKKIRTLTGHNKGVNSFSFNHDGSILASGSIDGTIKLWYRSSGWGLDELIEGGCERVHNYLKSNPNVSEEDNPNVSEEDKKLCE